MKTTITGKNQVTLPAELVRALGLEPGTQLDWRIGPNRTLVATPRPTKAQQIDAFVGAGRRYLRPGTDPVADLIAEREEDEGAETSA
jgi:bifunctional DNA-binding transcriptional regulator/antitoxin component of YhaV-PrlF toxin-antitoxin module